MYLEWLDKDGGLARLAVDPTMEAVTIGRSPAATIHSKETSVSRNHARIGWEPAGYYIKDLGSSNGSFINGERVQRGTLREGDVARCGEVLEIRLCAGTPANGPQERLETLDAAPRRLAHPTGAISGSEREALVAKARAVRLGLARDGLRTDARPATPPPGINPADRQPPPNPSLDASQRIAQLEEQLATTRAVLAEMESDAKAGEARAMRYSLDLDGLSDKYLKLKAHNQLLSQELDKSRGDLHNRENEVLEAGRTVTELKAQVAQSREKAAKAAEQLSGLKMRVTQKDRQNEALQHQLDLLEYELRAARDENESLQANFNREGGDLSRLERKINLLQEVIQEKEALIEQLRMDLRDKDTEIRQVRIGVGLSDLEHEKRRLLEDFHQATRRVDELNDRLLQQSRQTEALQGELDTAREAADRKPTLLADVTEHPDFKQKVREVERVREELSQLQRDLAGANVELEAVEAKLHDTELRLNDALMAPKRTALPDDLAGTIENLLDDAVATRSNAAVVRRYVADLQEARVKWPELADTLELVNDMASVLASDLADQAHSLEVLHRQVVATSARSAEKGPA